jgi:GTP-binding protein HflX
VVTIAAVDSVLQEIHAEDQPRLMAFNKSDLLSPEDVRELRVLHPEAIVISAATGEGLDELRDAIETTFAQTLRPVELLVPYAAGARLAELHDVAGELEREDRADGVLVRARVPAALVHRFAEFALNGSENGRPGTD